MTASCLENDVDWTDAGLPPDPESLLNNSIDEGSNSLYTDVAALLDGELPEPPTPVLLTRQDGRALLYAGRVNMLFGDPEVGKSWVALAAATEGLRDGRKVLIADIDHNGADATVANLLLLGAPAEILRDPNRFRHCEPEEPGDLYRMVEDCRNWRPAVAVVDSVGELLPMMGLSTNSGDEYTIANNRVLQPLANVGAAVIAIDHLAKDINSRAIGPTGTGAKRRALGGASIRVKPGRQFVPGKGGSAHLVVNKDRHGGVRKHCASGEREPLAGTFVMSEADESGAVSWRILPPLDVIESLEPKAQEFAKAVQQFTDEFTAKEAAAVVFPEAPTASQVKQATYHLEKLTEAGVLEQVSRGRRGAQSSRWRVCESAGGANPKASNLWDDEANPNGNPKESED